MNIKSLYDKVMSADAARNLVAQDVVRLNDEGKYDEALALQPKLDSANKEYKDANKLYLSMLEVSGDKPQNGQNVNQRFVPAGGQTNAQEAKAIRETPEYQAEWMDAFRRGVTPKNLDQNGGADRYARLVNALTESGGSPAGEDGGFLNPIEFDNKIRELMREYVDLGNSVNVEDVTTLAGWRVVEQFAAASPLTETTVELAVKADGDEGESPKFNKVDYSLREFSDFLRVGNNLMSDTPINLMTYLAKWFSKKLILTHNSLVLTKINAISATAVADYKNSLSAIKTVLNKTLDPAFSASASVFTNQSGLDMLDQLDDGTGRPLLQPDPSSATAFRVKGRPVVILSDAHWANLSGPARARIAIGDGREYLTLFRRSGFEFASTNVGGNAWRSNSSEVRGIARLDCEEVDTGAMAVLAVTL
jgi:HK97 family phage major capsid protein